MRSSSTTPGRLRAATPAPGYAPSRDRRAAAPRLPWVDALRVHALLAVFVVHAASPFDPWDRWHVTDAARSPLLGEMILLFAPWLMPLSSIARTRGREASVLM